MDLTVLNGYMELKKKNDLSKEKKKEFQEQIKLVLEEEGYQVAEKYIFSCISIMGMNCLATYLDSVQTEKQNEIFKEIISSDKYKSNEKNISYRVAIGIMDLICNRFYEADDVLPVIIRDIPVIVKTKDGKYYSEFSKIFSRNFAAFVNNKSKLPDLNKIGLSEHAVDNFKLFAIKCINSGESSNMIKAYSLEILKKWIGIENGTQAACQDKIENTDTDGNKKNSNRSDILKNISKQLADIAEAVESYEIKIAKYERDKTALEKALKGLEKSNTELAEKIESQEIVIKSLNDTVNEQNTLLEQKDINIKDLNDEIEKMKSVVTVISDAGESAVDEKLNAVASKLKSEYSDFMDSMDMEMSIDLGENLRYQLKSIFKILSKAGIDVGGRN